MFSRFLILILLFVGLPAVWVVAVSGSPNLNPKLMVQAPTPTMICWDNITITRDSMAWTAWDCTADKAEKPLGPKVQYEIVHGSGVVAILNQNYTRRYLPIPATINQHLMNDLGHIIDILGQAHTNAKLDAEKVRPSATIEI